MFCVCVQVFISPGFPLCDQLLLSLFVGSPHLPQSSVPRLFSTLPTLHFSLYLQDLVLVLLPPLQLEKRSIGEIKH